MKDCIKCLVGGVNHPFHDNGEVNPEADLSEFAPIAWFKDKDGKVTG